MALFKLKLHYCTTRISRKYLFFYYLGEDRLHYVIGCGVMEKIERTVNDLDSLVGKTDQE